MASVHLTTDIIVIICLIVVLILVGLFAFLIHFYWTKIGLSDIWNTTRWSSMRSSIHKTFAGLGRNSTRKVSSAPLKPNDSISSNENKTSSQYYSDNFTRDTHVKEIRPSVIEFYPAEPASSNFYNNPVRTSYATKIGQPIETTRIHSIHEYESSNYDPVVNFDRQRF